MLRPRIRVVLTALAAIVVACSVRPAGAQSPPGSAGAKAAAKCQQAIAKANAKFLAQRLKRLATCSNGVLGCVQTLPDPTACVSKATAKCRKQLGTPDVPDAAAAKLEAAVVKACGTLPVADLLAAGGLGFGDAASACGAVGVPALAAATDVARCLQRLHGGTSEEAYGVELPRAAELTALAGVSALVVPDLPPFDGCGGCGALAGTGKAVAGCGAAIAKAAAAFLAKARAGIDKCTAALIACAQTKPGDLGCAGKAKATCERLPTDLAKARAALVGVLAKKCGGSLGFASLVAPSGTNVGALACACKQVGVEPVASVNDYALCLTRQHECAVASLLPSVAPRADGLLADQGLAIDDLLCAPPTSSLAHAGLEGRANFGFFGSILKFVKKVTPGGLRPSAAPFANRGSARRVGLPTFGGCHAKPGGSCTFRFPITKKPANLQKERGTPAPPPALVIAVQRADGSFAGDHFEVDLPDTSTDGEVEVQIDYADDLESCAFDIAATVAEDGVVAPYTTVEQVPHVVPANDVCTAPRGIEGSTFNEVLDVTAATALVDEPATPCADGGLSRTVFYEFTAPSNGFITADTFGSDYDTVIALWSGTCGAPAHLTCADDTAESAQSKIAWPVAQGTTYLIGVGSVDGTPPETSTLHFAFRFEAAGEPPTVSKLSARLLELAPNGFCEQPNQSAFEFTLDYQDPDGDVVPTIATLLVRAEFEPSGAVSIFPVPPGTLHYVVSGDGFTGTVSVVLCTFFSQDTSVVTTMRLGDLAGAGNALSVKTSRPPGAL